MITQEQFDTGLRLDQYIASISQNKENFRANFIKAIEAYSPDDILFFRSLPQKIRVAVVTDDENQDALRDVPLIGRISVEVGRVMLRAFRPSEHPDVVFALAKPLGAIEASRVTLPIIVFYSEDMRMLGAHIQRLPDLNVDMHDRQRAWVEAHPEVLDAHKPVAEMSPITRTRMAQILFSLTSEQRLHWARKTVSPWRAILTPPAVVVAADNASESVSAAPVVQPPTDSTTQPDRS